MPDGLRRVRRRPRDFVGTPAGGEHEQGFREWQDDAEMGRAYFEDDLCVAASRDLEYADEID